MGKIKCPYCFEEFESDKVLFRANTGFTQEELDREEFTSGDVGEHKRLFVKFSQRNPDEKLDRYWTSRGGTAGYSSADPRWNMPHIDPNDADRFWEMLDPDANGVGEVGNPKCGDIMRMYLKIENNVIVDVKFLTFGCGAAIATSSMATDLIKGKTIDEALKLTNKAVVEALEGLPPVKVHCSVLAEQAVKAALSDYYRRQGIDPEPIVGKLEEDCDHCSGESCKV